MRTWSYSKITRTAEACIKTYTKKAAQETDSQLVRRVHLDWAYGAFALWDEVTRGSQKEEDKIRLRTMAMNLREGEA
jgi:hypothetical protein